MGRLCQPRRLLAGTAVLPLLAVACGSDAPFHPDVADRGAVTLG